MLNKVILRGHIGRDPEVKVTQKGRQIATFFLATRFSWKDEKGEWQTHTDWHRITIFRESTIGWVKDILKKGDMVYVEGKLSNHSWIDKFQQKRFTTHVVIEDWHGRIEHLRENLRSCKTSHEEGASAQETTQKDTLQDPHLFLSSRRETGQEPAFHASQVYSPTSQNLSRGENPQEDIR